MEEKILERAYLGREDIGRMKKTVEIVVANPAGNITIFVKTPFERKDYQAVATRLLAMEELKGEQVAFITSADPAADIAPERVADGSVEMCGLEFCGNASRSFALLLAKEAGDSGTVYKTIRVSGCDELLTVEADMEKMRAKVRMPLPLSCEKKQECTIVDFGGILHIIVEDLPAEREIFDMMKNRIYEQVNPPALGVMFWDTAEKKLEPVVYVKDVDTVYFEGSCGSGTTAVAAAFAQGLEDGTYSWSVPQPAGVIDAAAEVRGGRLVSLWIDSPVELSEAKLVEIDL